MTITVEGPDKSSFDFPDGTPEATITSAMAQHYGAPAAAAPPTLAAFNPNDPRFAEHAQASASALRGMPLVGAGVNRAGAMISAAAHPLTGVGSDKPTYAERVVENMQQEEAAQADYETKHPVRSAVEGMIGGSLALGGAGGAIPAVGKVLGMTGPLVPAATRAAVSGAGIGGADAALRGADPVAGAEIGALTGAGGVVAGKAVGKVWDAVRGAFRTAPVVPRTMDVNDRPVPIDKAIETGTAADSTTKQALIHQSDPKTAQIAREGMEATDQGLRGTVEDFKSSVGRPAQPEPHTARSAAEELQVALQQGNADSRAGVKSAYDAAGAVPGEYTPSLIQNTPKVVRTQLGQGDKVILDDLTPRGKSAMDYLDTELGQMNLTTNAAATPLKIGPDGRPIAEPITPSSIEQVRKNLNRYLKQAQKDGNAADVRAVTRIKDAFDSHITNATKTPGGFTGDAAEVLRLQAEARATHAAHKQNYSAQAPGDLAGRTIENIIGKRGVAPLDVESIIPKIFGSPNNPGGGVQATLVRRLTQTLGPNSPTLHALRQGVFSHAADMLPGMAPVGHKVMADRITKLLESSLGKELFTDAQQEAMRNIANAHRRVLPVPGTTNPPGSGHVMVRGMKAMGRAALPIIGAATHGPAGFAVGLAAEKAGSALANRGARRAAERFFQGERGKRSSLPKLPESLAPQRFGALGGFIEGERRQSR